MSAEPKAKPAWSGSIELFGFMLSDIGLRPKASAIPSFQQWRQLGEYLRFMEGSISWLIGDWMRYGEEHFKQKMSQALELTGWAVDTVKQYTWVAERVKPETRDADLSFSHHRVVADLPQKDQKKLLAHAKKEGLTVREFQREVTATRHPDKQTVWLLVSCTSLKDRERLIREMEKAGRSVRVP